MLSPELTNTGKRFDRDARFRLVFNITKGDKRGTILTKLAQGWCVAWKTLDEAIAQQNKFHEMANNLDLPALGDFASYGFSAVVDEKSGTVNNVLHIG